MAEVQNMNLKRNTFCMNLFRKKKLFSYQSSVDKVIWYRTNFTGKSDEFIKPLYFNYIGLGQYETEFYINIFIYENLND